MVASLSLLWVLISYSQVNAEPEPGLASDLTKSLMDSVMDQVVEEAVGGLVGNILGGDENDGLVGGLLDTVDGLLGGGGSCDKCGGDGLLGDVTDLVGDVLGTVDGLLGGGGSCGKCGDGGLLGGVTDLVGDLLNGGINVNVLGGAGKSGYGSLLGVDVGDLLNLEIGGGGGCGCGCGDSDLKLEVLGNVLDLVVGGDGNIKNNKDSLLSLDLLDGLVDIGLGGGGGGCGGRKRRKSGGSSKCYKVDTIDFSVNDQFCLQPLFVNFLPKTEAHTLIDNVCYTFFPLPDDPYTFNLYRASVFCDGSSRIETAIVTELCPGRSRIADPYCTMTANVLGYAGCDTYVVYRCMEFGDCACDECCPNIIGLSPSCAPLGLSCIQKVEEIIDCTCIPRPDFVILPMKLPNRCVTEQICINNIKGNFFRALNLPGPGPILL